MKKIQLLSLFLLLNVGVFSQAYFKHYKSGETFFKNQEYKSAVEEFTKVIELKSDHDRAFNYRGLSYEGVGDYEKAAFDFKKAAGIKVKIAEYHSNLGKAYYHLKKFDEAIASLTIAIGRDKKLMASYSIKVHAHIALKQFPAAVETGKLAVAKMKSAETYYNLGVAQDSLMHFKEAAYNFSRAKFYDPKMAGAYIGMAYSNMKLNEFKKAIEYADKSLELEPENIHALLVRADVHIANRNPQKAVDDFSIIISFNPEEMKYFMLRGDMYQELGQSQNAIEDYTKVINLKGDDYFVYYQRAKAYEVKGDYKSAIKDYEALRKLSPYDGRAIKLYDEAKKRLYELNKESNNPELTMLDPVSPEEGILAIPKGSLLYVVKGEIKDQSNIAFIKINGKDANFNKDTINPAFELEMNIQDAENLTITVFDIYQNSETWIYKLLETEVNAPIVKLLAPYASDDGTVYLDTDDPTLYVEGNMMDESLIKNIYIEGATASFVLDEKNPKFSATINIMNKDEFTITAEDKYGNKVEKKFIINRENIALLADNPMGKTWVIFIENAKYKTFASLEGPTKDVTMMKSAFAKYKIHNIVHKKNMTKAQLERFFSIELRDLVKSNQVKSLLVWYAGHGKFINETGYWIPTDAKRDDEFTYFNINNLKASMQSYSKFIIHTLVITDACESGPSFYQAMRSTPKDRSCNDWQATKFKSSQVFSSAGYELATDNSQFTKTFANTLNSNPNSCIPIETVVKKVKIAVSKGGTKQKPKFGKIAGLEDENGTFFFIKK
ncbi:MAG: tetratricopeptide repeat protein [Flavobacteriales bacterium]|nr:tetratricopeptide repeat protein [Flavobacteriales bacterium]